MPLAVSSQRASAGATLRAVPAGMTARSASTAHTPYCQRGESLSRSSHFTSSNTAATAETVRVW